MMEEKEERGVYIVDTTSEQCWQHLMGGKARNLWRLSREVQCQVPQWFCITTEAFSLFIQVRVYQLARP